MDKQGVISFLDYKVNRVEFINNDSYNGEEVDIEFDVSAQCFVSDNGEEMIVVLNTNIFEPKEGKVYPFRMCVEVEGYFKSNFEDKKQDIGQYEKNAVAILFPYVRALVSTSTANANVTPLILPTVNVNKMLDKGK